MGTTGTYPDYINFYNGDFIMQNVIVVTVVKNSQIECQNVYSQKNIALAEQEYIKNIIENDVEIEDSNHRNALLEDGLCDIVGGIVTISHNIMV